MTRERVLHLLLIEDNPADARLIREMLVDAQSSVVAERFSLHHADRLATGLAYLAEGRVDMLLLDLSLPDGRGMDTLAQARALAPGVPIVVLTGLDDGALAVKAMQAGAQDYLVKGHVDGHALSRAIRYAIERRQREEALRQSEMQFRLLAEFARDIIYRYRVVSPRGFEYISPAVAAITGYTPQDHYADPDLIVKQTLPDDRAKLQHLLETGEGMDGPADSLVLRWTRKDGATIWTELRNVLLYDPSGSLTTLVGIARDITERIVSEAAVVEMNRRLRLALDEQERLYAELQVAHEELTRTQAQVIQQERLRALGQMASGIAHDFNNALSPVIGFSELLLKGPARWPTPSACGSTSS